MTTQLQLQKPQNFPQPQNVPMTVHLLKIEGTNQLPNIPKNPHPLPIDQTLNMEKKENRLEQNVYHFYL